MSGQMLLFCTEVKNSSSTYRQEAINIGCPCLPVGKKGLHVRACVRTS